MKTETLDYYQHVKVTFTQMHAFTVLLTCMIHANSDTVRLWDLHIFFQRPGTTQGRGESDWNVEIVSFVTDTSIGNASENAQNWYWNISRGCPVALYLFIEL